MTQQETMTDRLVSIIQLIQLGRRTGILRVRRGEGKLLEEGEIAFANGQIIQAQTSRYRGSEATSQLSAWGTCHFIFSPSDTSEQDTSPRPFKGVGNDISDANVTGNPSGLENQRTMGNLSGPRYQSLQGSRPSTGPITPLSIGDLNSLSHPQSPVPYRKLEINTALNLLERKKLSRAHRRLLFLIDGQRSIEELVRLIGRDQKEVQILLNDLEQAVIIAF